MCRRLEHYSEYNPVYEVWWYNSHTTIIRDKPFRTKKNVKGNICFALARIPPEKCILTAWIVKFSIPIVTKETELNRKST